MITPYRPDDFAAIVELLREVFPREAISAASFARKVLLDLNFDPQGAFVARGRESSAAGNATESVLGFLLALTRKRPLEDAPWDGTRGWITLMGVAESARRQGIGTALLDTAENWLRTQGRREAWISPYAPGYWTPGVDESACAEGLSFLQRHGYVTAYRPLSMEVSLEGWLRPEWLRGQHDAQELNRMQVSSLTFQPWMATPLTEFLRQEFPGDWQRYLRETMHDIVAGRRPQDELRLLFHRQNSDAHSCVTANRLVGFAQSEGERFGPFGVAKAWRGKGLGAILLVHVLEDMQRRGMRNAWFLWTDDTTANRLYKPVGFRETRRYAVLKKSL